MNSLLFPIMHWGPGSCQVHPFPVPTEKLRLNEDDFPQTERKQIQTGCCFIAHSVRGTGIASEWMAPEPSITA